MLKKTNIVLIITFTLFSIFVFSIKVMSKPPSETSEMQCLSKTYENFKKDFMSKDGRVMDPERHNLTTSEGQGYMLTLSVVMDQHKNFDLVWKWTKNNLQRKDKLFAWLWDKDETGTYRILDKNSASDADVNIALALCFAHVRWGGHKYLDEALPIIRAIWDK